MGFSTWTSDKFRCIVQSHTPESYVGEGSAIRGGSDQGGGGGGVVFGPSGDGGGRFCLEV